MSVNVTPHLNFRGQARQALAFYGSVFGGTPQLVTYRDAQVPQPEAELDHVLWGNVQAATGFQVMAFDVPSDREWQAGTNAFFVSVTSESAEETREIWERLGEGATVIAPLGPSAWSPQYGMVRDRFGITWIVTQGAAG